MKEKYFSSKLIILIIILLTCLFLFSFSSLALIPGDFGSANNGPPDGVVDFEDLMIFALAYGSSTGDTNWNLDCDIAGPGSTSPDGVIDFEDLMVFAMHYGEYECVPPSAPNLSDPGSSLPSPATYTVSWSAVSGATSYVLQEATSSNFSSGLQEYPLTDTSKNFSHTVTTSTTYYYRVAAVNDYGQGGWSSVEDIIINCCTLPSAPTLDDPGSSLPSPATYTVSWSSVSGATSYVLQEATSSDFSSGLQEYPLTDTSKSFSHTVTTSTTYYYRVAAVNDYGQGGWSNVEDIDIVSTYNIRDIGPAGGWIFYDKGDFSDGWRYLEALPFDNPTHPPPVWSSRGTLIGGTKWGIGTGQSNTTKIVTWLNSHSETNRAAQWCDALVYGGYDDWFLPSLGELFWMYTNLWRYGVANFTCCKYWSSTEWSADYAWYQEFVFGHQSPGYKTSEMFIRAARAF